ncbi:MAG: hypothetical protein NDI69_17840 [Bacteriovoracaceae bacterium]|nr:hypothetical protein [Bacteriovoracaceae bacterium]
MIKFTFLYILLFSLISCQNDGTPPTSVVDSPPISGDTPPEVDIPRDGEYLPLGLSDKVIVRSGIEHAPMDLISQELTMTFNPDNQTVKGHSLIKFKLRNNGRPYFEVKATPKNVILDSKSVVASSISDPDGQNQSYWSLGQELPAGEIHEVKFDYELASGRVSFVNDGVRFLTDMTDLNGKFFEYWGPVGFEEDAFSLNLELKVINSSSKHTLYTNGVGSLVGSQTWKIVFPEYYSKSSFYVHLTNQTLPGKKFVYKGLTKEIPVEVYGLTTTLVNSAVSQLPKLLAELEGDYGPYPHAKFLAYMNDRSGGMEYVAATITSLASIDHELLHSWFARSVIPADGRSGWIDEAIASWRDYGYTRAKSTLSRTSTNLADYSPFRKSTPSNSYVDGRGLMSELDLEFKDQGGLKPVLKAFFTKYKNLVVTNEEFWHFLEEHTKLDLEPFQEQYVLGSAEEAPENPNDPSIKEPSKHPTPLSKEEVLRLR